MNDLWEKRSEGQNLKGAGSSPQTTLKPGDFLTSIISKKFPLTAVCHKRTTL